MFRHNDEQISWKSCPENNGLESITQDTIKLYRDFLSDNPNPLLCQSLIFWNFSSEKKLETVRNNIKDKSYQKLSFRYIVKYDEKSKSHFLKIKKGATMVTYLIKDVYLDPYYKVDVIILVRSQKQT